MVSSKEKYYAIINGRNTNTIVRTWEEAKH